MYTAADIKKELRRVATPTRALASMRFFKTGSGQYGEGDIFCGATMPEQRALAKKYRDLPKTEIITLLHSKIHEERMIALLIIVDRYERAAAKEQAAWFKLIWNERKWINNWDLVDVNVPRIIGHYFLTHNRQPLNKLIKSKNIWERRIAILATFAFIRQKDFTHSLLFAKAVLGDTHDLMHKAAGWMLREVGKCSRPTLETFLEKYRLQMPRTMLRYAIEHFPPEKRKQFLSK